MSYSVWYQVALRCPCGQWTPPGTSYTYQILLEPQNQQLGLGQTLARDDTDFDDAFFRVPGHPRDHDPLHALELWGCPACRLVRLATVTFVQVPEGHLLESVETFQMTPEETRRLTLASWRVVEELRERPEFVSLVAALSLPSSRPRGPLNEGS